MQRGEWSSPPLMGKFMLRKNPKYIVRNVEKFVRGNKDTGVLEKGSMQNTILTNLLMPQKIDKPKLTEKDMQELNLDPKDLLVEINGEPVKPQSEFVRSKSNLYKGDRCVYDIYRDALSSRYYKEMLQEYQNASMPSSELFGPNGNSSLSTTSQNRSRDGNKKGLRLSVVGVANVANNNISTGAGSDADMIMNGINRLVKANQNGSAKSKNDTSGEESVKGKDSSIKRDPRRLVPIKVEDRAPPESLVQKKKKINEKSSMKRELLSKGDASRENIKDKNNKLQSSKPTKKSMRSASKGLENDDYEKDFEIQRSKGFEEDLRIEEEQMKGT